MNRQAFCDGDEVPLAHAQRSLFAQDHDVAMKRICGGRAPLRDAQQGHRLSGADTRADSNAERPMRTTMHLACVLALGVCSVAQPAQAKPAVWMEGTWSLDAQSSTSLDPVLRAMGYGWIARKVMSSLAVKQVIRATGRGISFHVEVITRFTDEAIVLPVDNRWAIGKNLDGGTTERRSRWLGNEILTEDRFPQG